MKRLLAVALTALATTALVSADLADARRLGGGRNIGAQRQSVQPATPPAAAPSPASPTGPAANPVMPGQPAAGVAKAAPGAAAAPAASGASRWLGPVVGLAAGLGLAALAAHLGLSEALMSALLIGLAIVVVFALLRFMLARRAPAQSSIPYAGSGAGLGGRAGGYETQTPPSNFEPVFGGAKAPVEPVLRRFPPGFEPEPFIKQAKLQFKALQGAYDRGDRAALADVMTPELFAEITQDLAARTTQIPTEIVMLEADVVDVATEGEEHWASVRFRGLTREDGANNPAPFDELWNLVKPADGSSGWLLAGVRQIDDAPVGHA